MGKGLLAICASVFGVTYLKVVTAERAQRRVGEGAAAGSGDAIVVFGGKCYERGPSIEVRERLDHAVALYQRGVAPRVLLSGGVDEGVDEVDVMRAYVVKRGLPMSDTGDVRPGDNTRQTISGLDPRVRYVAVSSAYHAHRIGAEARRQGKVVIVDCVPDSIDVRNGRVLRVQRMSEVAGSLLYASPEGVAVPLRRAVGRLRNAVPDKLMPVA